jgi:UrcA family protein
MKVLDVLSTIGALVLAVTPLAVVGVAHAEPATPVSIQVGDLDFGSRADVARFNTRVVKAADTLCSETDVRDMSQRAACVSAVRDEAVARLGSAQRQEMIAANGGAPALRLASAQ